ncbi:MAG: phosphoribosyl-AMP cyclohydrolase [Actinobacteria bacterium]|jgi:phosphoribosyl-AMP cyclohydrolase|nr:phosphoribosyl-AMP cyclohydrolase [Actinomycetota bacterium]NCV42926.1 phosphoribosyl-AMP cyclohydrolase [Actinomycetota bacterium]NCV81950.1 phosphoribosyl-AMP cyclohydrolase [Actinomycetota bacterium]NCX16931.1 phosphoribosyl-AMP cyclohydrolase [Actinomycetota bacterium]NCX38157.1 phosphoribosyl-AMP cyclohydrolase [Actinomycetota bacterium]
MSSLDPAVIALLKDPTMLIPAVIQDSKTNEVLMLAYMNTESLALTLSTGKATYWSRSRNELWVKGATSGHFQKVISVALDCDGDALLLHVEQTGVACHTGERTCFHTPIALGK